MEHLNELFKYIDRNTDRFIEDLRILCQQPSVSAQKKGIDECVGLLEKIMEDIGLEARIFEIKNGNPIVFGELRSGSSKECLGFYNHYDVQPPDPLDEWKFPPFNPVIKDGKLYARGASDDKGDLISRLEAVRVFLEVRGDVPVSLKFLIEGEEESGSPHLPDFVRENADLLKADGYLWEGEGVDMKGRPIVTLGAKGILHVEFRTRGPKVDVHSSRAPLVPNPAWRLVWMLSMLKGPDEKIKIPGWYDDVVPPDEEDMRLLEEAPFDEEADKRELGLKEYLLGVIGVESLKTLLFSPTCNISGFLSGYTGPGTKTVLPSEAFARVDFRLVVAQKPDLLFRKLKNYLRENGFGDVTVIKHSAYEAAKTPVNDPFVTRVVKIAKRIYGLKPVIWPTAAGTGPLYVIRNWLGIPVVSAGGAGYSGSRIHAPNENIRLKDYIRSIKYMVALINSYEE
ncbi:M20/M25/M40 family metallo-hydrolase [Candidatus Bathyarchaeota archaeon]|nr:M20/M25/M40 family metallo-hydrolase [Candidatus Bathyarchaeota archaeon]